MPPHQQSRRQYHLQHPKIELAQSRPMYRQDQLTQQRYAPLDSRRQPRNEEQLQGDLRQSRLLDLDDAVQPRRSSAQIEPPSRFRDSVMNSHGEEYIPMNRDTGLAVHNSRPRTSHNSNDRPLLKTFTLKQVHPPSDGQDRAVPRGQILQANAQLKNVAQNEDLIGLAYRHERSRPQNNSRPVDISVPNLSRGGPALSNAHLSLDTALLETPTLDRDMLDLECAASFSSRASSRFDVPAMVNHDSLEVEQRGSLETELTSPSLLRQEQEREYFRQQREKRRKEEFTTKDFTDSDSPQN